MNRFVLDREKLSPSYLPRLQAKMEAMERWAGRDVECRRAALLAYFGESCPKQDRCCDRCDEGASSVKPLVNVEDVTADAKLILSTIQQTGKNKEKRLLLSSLK